MKACFSLLIIVIFTLIIGACVKDENPKIDKKMNKEMIDAINNMPNASDIDEVNQFSDDLKKRYKKIASSKGKQDLKFYILSLRYSIRFDIYEIVDKSDQDKISEIINDIRLERKIKKKITIRFFLKENFIKLSEGYLRKDEKLLDVNELE